MKLESPESTTLSAFWNSSTCEWLKQAFDRTVKTGRTKEHINHNNQGSILADDMGLGKTLTSLALIVTSKTIATEICKHLDVGLTKYVVYHVANLYESGVMRCSNRSGFAPYWTSTTQQPSEARAILALETQRKLCLTGTPLQNQLSDLYTLLRFIRVDPWSREEVWQTFIKPNIRRKSAKAIELLQRLLATVSLRRTENRSAPVATQSGRTCRLQLLEPWQGDYRNRYHDFADRFGVDRGSGSWDSSEFFQQLTMHDCIVITQV
ncbi:hypothetical protein KEM48_007690 [Puccinia striiformis f. sp. tritici PST-130]|nr:hypothetical protein KEM48_007690 [Puccinia striiformis f. sp. tritici PST-130]